MEGLLKVESVDFTYSVRKVYYEMSIEFDWTLPDSFKHSTILKETEAKLAPSRQERKRGRTSRDRTSSSEPFMTGHDEKGRKVAENLLQLAVAKPMCQSIKTLQLRQLHGQAAC